MANGKTPASPPSGVEITLVANFPEPTPADSDQVDRMLNKTWEPSLDYFRATANVHKSTVPEIFVVKTLMEFTGAIQSNPAGKERPSKSVRRVNLLTHANSNIIALGGTLNASNSTVLLGRFNRGDPQNSGGFDFDSLVWLDTDSVGTQLRDIVRDKRRDDAEIFIYGCGAGTGVGLLRLQDLAKVFKVKIQAFNKEIGYCPTFNTKTKTLVDRTLTRMGACDPNNTNVEKSGFKHLAPDRTVPKPP